MTNIEMEILMRLSMAISQLDEADKLYLLGLADGMSLMNKKNENILLLSEKEKNQFE